MIPPKTIEKITKERETNLRKRGLKENKKTMGRCCSIRGRGRNDSTETYRGSHQGGRDKSEEEGGLRRCEQSKKTMGCCCSIRGRGRNDSTETYRESHQERDKSEEEGAKEM
ncbi:hypothetical protein J6590_106019 [Homalodisca vitripennis]|nr:hypothetical protein J6590_106019 [Homalodisca vitripennis]